MFAGLKWSAAGASALVAAWLALGPFSAPAWVAASFALVIAVLALRVPAAAGSMRLRREGWCEWFDAGGAPGARGVEMEAIAAFSGAGWLVLRLRERGVLAGAGRGGQARILVVAPDAASAEELRQLRVWIRLAAPRAAALNSGGA